MEEYIDANRTSWATIAQEHFETFKRILSANESTLNQTQTQELGDINGKKLIHLQCNTGADTVSLARMGATVTGVDLAPENIHYAKKLAADLGISEAVRFEGAVDRESIPQMLDSSAIYCSMLDTDGLSASLIEAMAAGLFPVVTDIPANKIWI